MWDFGIFDQAQVQDRESSHYGLWQISIRPNDKLLYKRAKQHPRQHKYTLAFRETLQSKLCINLKKKKAVPSPSALKCGKNI